MNKANKAYMQVQTTELWLSREKERRKLEMGKGSTVVTG